MFSVIPLSSATGKEKLSITTEDLKRLLTDLQASPSLVDPLINKGGVGSKTQYNMNNQRQRTGKLA